MPVFTYAVAYGATAVVFFCIDFVWLSLMGGRFYKPLIGDIMLEQPNLPVAGLFYLFYVVGIVYLAVIPAYNSGNWTHALIAGLVLGFVAYGTYDFTNLSTIKNWPMAVTIVDLIWGTLLTATAACAGFFALQAIK